MLQTQSVYAATLELLKELSSFEPLSNFNLVGGTALALQYGHRISIDLDFFSIEKFDSDNIKRKLTEHFGEERITWQLEQEFAMILKIDDVKVDIIHYPYPLIDELIIEDGIRMLSTKDIGAMKLSAVSKRGVKKDFFDLYELLQEEFNINELFEFYKEKFSNHEISFVARSMMYFEDAEDNLDPIMIKKYNWEMVKKEMLKQVQQYIDNQI